MTDNDIIKALECCVIDNSCSKCPHYNNGKQTRECLEMSIKFAIDLINRQKAEIEDLKADKIIAERREKDAKTLLKETPTEMVSPNSFLIFSRII